MRTFIIDLHRCNLLLFFGNLESLSLLRGHTNVIEVITLRFGNKGRKLQLELSLLKSKGKGLRLLWEME